MADDGSFFKVPYTKILNITNHPRADRLEIATVYGFQVIVRKNQYKINDEVIYVPIDSILPESLELKIFGNDSKIKLHNHRVRQIKIRGLVSQGMLININDVSDILGMDKVRRLGSYEPDQDLAKDLGITKYEPPRSKNTPRPSNPRNKPLENPRFHKYGGVNNIKWFPDFFNDQEVVVQEKLHGSCCRASYSKTSPNTLWKKILNLFKLLPTYEYCYGSNNVQLQERGSYKGFYGTDVYGAVLKKIDAFNKLKPGETIFGELIGSGIQANYEYGHKEHHFVLYDVKIEKEDGTQEYLDPEKAEEYAKERGFDFVSVLYKGLFNKEIVQSLAKGPSIYCPSEKVREGIVIKTRVCYSNNSSKKALKLINEDYLSDLTNTDDH